MARIVVTFLVAIQAVLPPGMCLCQFVPIAATPRPVHETAPVSQPAVAAEESCCSCSACRKTSIATLASHEPAATDREAPHEHRSLPTPVSPCSGCPVVSAGPASRVAILSAPEQAPLDTAVPFVIPTVEPVPACTDRPHCLVSPAAPLFVRHCAFLI